MTKKTAKLASTDHGFQRGMARELLIHNPQINTVTDALNLAQELITATAAASTLKPNVGLTHAYYPTD